MSPDSFFKEGSPLTLFKHINRQNNHERGSSYVDILVSRTLYMSSQAGPGIEPGPSALKASALPIELTWQTLCVDGRYGHLYVVSTSPAFMRRSASLPSEFVWPGCLKR